MKLLFLTHYKSSGIGGVERHVGLLTRELLQRGHEVKEVSLEQIAGASRPKSSNLHPDKLKSWKFLWDNKALFSWADIIHIHDVFWWYFPFRFLYPFKRIYITLHGWEGEFPPRKSAVFQKKLASFLCKSTIGVGKFIEKWYGVELDAVTWGAVEIPEVTSRNHRSSRRIIYKVVFFGRLEKVNGIEVACQTFAAMHSPKVLFIGDGSERKMAEKVGDVTGMVPEPWNYLRDADIVVASSYLSILEANALGKPVIAISTNPLKEDYLRLHPLAEHIAICHNANEVAEALSRTNKTAPIQAQRWARGQTAAELANLYEGVWEI